MTGFNKLQSVAAIVFVAFVVFSRVGSARLLTDEFRPQNIAATEPALNLVLPGGDVGASLESGSLKPLPSCESEPAEKLAMQFPLHAPLRGIAAGNKNWPLVFNILPKGNHPPSAPSKGINKVIN
uniref:Uncharacterized protein n=1 Tax=Nelumbo nucifera TaxID=4432 RepID=A0A822Z1T1_NELNU|nr:TPA_asm: hypothetical protein HUJ06_012962 [Nelumbo nucifera]